MKYETLANICFGVAKKKRKGDENSSRQLQASVDHKFKKCFSFTSKKGRKNQSNTKKNVYEWVNS